MPKKELKIGLALGGGGAKGSAHIGVLKVFKKHGIKISSIVGTSCGAIVGGAYALGLEPEKILKKNEDFSKSKFLRFSNIHFFHDGLIKNWVLANAIKTLVGRSTFKDLKIPFKAVAVNLESGEEVLLEDGKLWEAIRASSAIPGIFSPYFFQDKYLVDGGLLNNVPVNYLRKQNVDIVIGVELQDLTERQYLSGIIWKRYFKKPKKINIIQSYLSTLRINSTLIIHILRQSIQILQKEAQNHRYAEGRPDIMIRPKVEHVSLLEFKKYKESVAFGEEATEAIMPALLKLIEEKQKANNV